VALVARDLGHEAIHARDFKSIYQSGFRGLDVWRQFNNVRYRSEYEGYAVVGAVRQAIRPSEVVSYRGNVPILGTNRELPLVQQDLWNPSWFAVDSATIDRRRDQSIRNILAAPPYNTRR
jgi:hypothetical protein